jgi:conserved domain protein
MKGVHKLILQITLRAARVNAGYTQEEVAKKMGVTKQTVLNWETGRNKLRIPEMHMLSKLYKIPMDNIILPQ